MMDSQKLLVSRENPRSLAFPTARLVSSSAMAKSMPNEIAQKPTPSIVDRFKALLKQRDDEVRVTLSSDDDDVPPPSSEEIVQLYELMLSELTFNSKPIITDLTIIAGEQREHGKGIADAICARILEVSVDQKLPSLYLLDSIVKNIGQEYVRYFSSCLPEVFCEAYRQVEPNMHHAMRHLFGTWLTVFPPSVLRKIEAQLQFSQPINNKSSNSNSLGMSESSRPTHGIHVNPKYLRQLDSTVDNAGGEKLESTGSAVHTSFGPGKIHPPFTNRLGRVSSPSGIGLNRPLSASIDEYSVDSSTGKMVERESPSHAAFDYGVGKAIGRDEELSEWPRKQFFSDSRNRFPISATYSLSNGHQRQSPRALIDAYGSDKRNEISSNKSLLVERLDINGTDNKVVSTSWQNTEEEEFDWEDMNPTLVDNSRNNGFLPSFSGERPRYGAPNAASLEQDTRSSWSGRPQFPLAEDSAAAGEDASASLGYGRGLVGQVSGFQTQTRPSLGSHHISIPRVDIKQFGIQPSISRMGSSSLESNVEVHQPILPTSFGVRPPVNMHITRPPILNPNFPIQKHARSQRETINHSNNLLAQGPNRSSFVLEQQLDGVENKDPTKVKPPHLSNNQTGVIAVNQQIHGQVTISQPQFGYGSSLPQHSAPISAAVSSSLPVMPFPLPAQNIANNLVPLQGALPPLPPGPSAASLQTINHPNISPFISSQQPATAFPGLINSLMAQGLISLSNQPAVKDSVGTEFNPDVLKVRHESAINALYADLPRQCTTCGLRFKCQEEHSSHMDWHVTKNRMSKSRKQKPSRKWFVSQSMWLSGAEALGTEAVPGFLPTETIEEKKDDDELAVPADEDQNTCALCGEPFDAFYSDEMEEWMYKGAVYLNSPKGATAGTDTSQLGPIVHAKCRTESSMVSPEDFRQDDGGSNEEGRQRKRMRI